MYGFSWFFIVLGVCYFLVLGLEYGRSVQCETWTPVKAKVADAINGLPLTKYEPNRLNNIATIVNWSFIKYSFNVGEGLYEGEQELGPHLTVFDYWVGPLAQRLPKDSTIDVKYNPVNPKESRVAFDVLKPVETLVGTGMVFLIIGGVGLFLSRVTETATGDDEELNQ